MIARGVCLVLTSSRYTTSGDTFSETADVSLIVWYQESVRRIVKSMGDVCPALPGSPDVRHADQVAQFSTRSHLSSASSPSILFLLCLLASPFFNAAWVVWRWREQRRAPLAGEPRSVHRRLHRAHPWLCKPIANEEKEDDVSRANISTSEHRKRSTGKNERATRASVKSPMASWCSTRWREMRMPTCC